MTSNVVQRQEFMSSMDYMTICPIDKFKELLDNGYDVNQQTERGTTLLGCLMLKQSYDKIKVLLNYNLNLLLYDKDGRTIYFAFISWEYNQETADLIDMMISMDINHRMFDQYDCFGNNVIAHYEKIRNKYYDILNNILAHQYTLIYDYLILKLKNHQMKGKTLFSMMLSYLNK